MMGIGAIPAILLAGAGAVWLGLPGLHVFSASAFLIALCAFAISRDSRAMSLALLIGCVSVLKFVVIAQPGFSDLLHKEYSAFSLVSSDWFLGGIAAISIPLSGLLGLYGEPRGDTGLRLFGGSAARFGLAVATWFAVSVALYAHFSGRELAAVVSGVVAAMLFIWSFRAGSKALAID